MARSGCKKGLKIGCGILALAALVFGIWLYPTIRDLASLGLFDRASRHDYTGTVQQNLKAIHTALMLYHDSEQQFPAASGWMDAVKTRLKTDDLNKDQEFNKLRDPRVAGKDSEVYGFAMNRAVQGKYKDDIKDPDHTILVFCSSKLGWNAFGDPAVDGPRDELRGGNLAVTVSGKIGKIHDLMKH